MGLVVTAAESAIAHAPARTGSPATLPTAGARTPAAELVAHTGVVDDGRLGWVRTHSDRKARYELDGQWSADPATAVDPWPGLYGGRSGGYHPRSRRAGCSLRSSGRRQPAPAVPRGPAGA